MNYQIFYGYYIVIQIDKFFEATNIEQDEHRNHQEDQDDRQMNIRFRIVKLP